MKSKGIIMIFWIGCGLYLTPTYAQSSYDNYQPMTYEPARYQPKSTGPRLTLESFNQSFAVSDLETLREFTSKTIKEKDANLIKTYQGSFNDYLSLVHSMTAKNKPDTEYLGKKKAMKFFQADYAKLEYYLFQKDSIAQVRKKQILYRDSIDLRKAFIQDSIAMRLKFVSDSTKHRNDFLKDSLYRANFRTEHNYDYVIFSGPHGEPMECYRKGKLIEKTIYKDGKKSEVWRNGRQTYRRIWFNELMKEYDLYWDAGREPDPLPIASSKKVIACYNNYYSKLLRTAIECGVKITYFNPKRLMPPFELISMASQCMYENDAKHHLYKDYVEYTRNRWEPFSRGFSFDRLRHFPNDIFPADHPMSQFVPIIDSLQSGFVREQHLHKTQIEAQIADEINALLKSLNDYTDKYEFRVYSDYPTALFYKKEKYPQKYEDATVYFHLKYDDWGKEVCYKRPQYTAYFRVEDGQWIKKSEDIEYDPVYKHVEVYYSPQGVVIKKRFLFSRNFDRPDWEFLYDEDGNVIRKYEW